VLIVFTIAYTYEDNLFCCRTKLNDFNMSNYFEKSLKNIDKLDYLMYNMLQGDEFFNFLIRRVKRKRQSDLKTEQFSDVVLIQGDY
jgi:hypothetical protein